MRYEKILSLNNIDSYTLPVISKMLDSYTEFIDSTDGSDISHPNYKIEIE